MRDEQSFDVQLDDEAAHRARPARWKAALGAIASVALLAAVVVWAYRLGVRDAYEVPVVRAIEGPSKIRPEEPGGARFAHQGRAVYGVLDPASSPEGEAALAAPPENLTDEDLPAAELTPAGPGSASIAPSVVAAPAAAAPSARDVAAAPAAPQEEPGSEVDRLVAAVLEAQPPGAAGAAAPARAAPPVARPGARVAAATAEAPASAAAPSSSPAAAGGGAAQVQLGAYLTEQDALAMWDAIRARNGDLLAGRAAVIAPLQSETRVLYRLRAAPFTDAAEARALCDALRARDEDCLIAGGE